MDYKPGSVTITIPITTVSSSNTSSPQQPIRDPSHSPIPVVPYGGIHNNLSPVDRTPTVQADSADGVYDIIPTRQHHS